MSRGSQKHFQDSRSRRELGLDRNAGERSREKLAANNPFSDSGSVETDGSIREVMSQAKSIRNESLEVTRESLSRLRQTESTASDTLVKMGQQGESLHQAKRDLDNATMNHKVAETQIGELKRLNKFFAFRNPFRNRNKDAKKVEAKIRSDYSEKINAEIETRKGERATERRIDKSLNPKSPRHAQHGANGAYNSTNRSNMLDDEDNQMENEIDSNLGEMSGILGRLKGMAVAMNDEARSQNRLIDDLGQHTDDMNVQIGMTTEKLKRYN